MCGLFLSAELLARFLYIVRLDVTERGNFSCDHGGGQKDVPEIGYDDLEHLNVPSIEANLHEGIRRRQQKKYGMILFRLRISKNVI